MKMRKLSGKEKTILFVVSLFAKGIKIEDLRVQLKKLSPEEVIKQDLENLVEDSFLCGPIDEFSQRTYLISKMGSDVIKKRAYAIFFGLSDFILRES